MSLKDLVDPLHCGKADHPPLVPRYVEIDDATMFECLSCNYHMRPGVLTTQRMIKEIKRVLNEKRLP